MTQRCPQWIVVSDKIPADEQTEIRKIIREAARALNRDPILGVEVHVKRAKPGYWRGYAYYGIPSVARVGPGARYLVTLKVGPRDDYVPRPWVYKQTARRFAFGSWDEELFHLVCHELWHLYQFREERPKSEVEAENRATAALERRRSKPVRSAAKR